MNDNWTNIWNERFSKDAFAYGKEPNIYLKEQLIQLPAGKILFAAEGEGRNAVFAARLGWEVDAFDISAEGKRKAALLAAKNDVTIDYRLGELESLGYQAGEFDAIGLIYAHFPAAIKSKYHRVLDSYLKKEGTVILEAFSKNHIDYIARNEKVGGPKEIDMLFSIEEIQKDFPGYEILELKEAAVELKEGAYHDGLGSVIRFVGRKK